MSKAKTVCIDFDATIHKYHGWKGIGILDEPIPGAKEFVNELYAKYKVIIFTCRLDYHSSITNWLQKYGFKYDKLLHGDSGEGKPKAIAYIDDRGVSCRPQENKNAYQDALIQIEKLSEKHRKT